MAVNELVDRQYVSRLSGPTFGIHVYKDGVLADADALPTVAVLEYTPGNPTPAVRRTLTATRESLGVYKVNLTSADTAEPYLGALGWTYEVDAAEQLAQIDYEVGQTSPAYDALGPDWKNVVEQVWLKFADLYDSPYGGPHLQVYIQTRFNRNRLAQLLPTALGRLNAYSGAHGHYEYNADGFPFSHWGPLLVQSLYMEVLKHLIRSYTEIPEAVIAASVSRMDRRDYMNRWQTSYDIELPEFTHDLDRFKMDHLGLGYSSVLVAGGAYPTQNIPSNPGGWGAAAARGYYFIGRYH